ncbi:FtsX-like permease family protein [Hydrogenimonas thermophila]|uniref:ABC transporter permease n=1 Tax=Hydrogenimonas thermophila TaxID=223786 RepID=UPI0029373FAD|nr:FtsX-like permease family protein [Hydrogenimonas thermophila]WOE70801.1 FtsX-like permease family protein [Hydrogenimonas thermophila]WOE73319.1 FtsX-like permease family protein [Hydrogenimonas thermophila]
MKHFLAFALNSLTRRSSKNLFIFIIFTFLIFILSSIFMITNALKTEMFVTLKSLPDITVQRIIAGRQTEIDVERCEEIAKLFGVTDVIPRVWGYYYIPNLGVNFSIVGVESFSKQYKKELQTVVDKFSDKLVGGDNMVVGKGVLRELKKIFFNDYFYFVKPDGSLKKVKIAGVFKPSTSLESNDIIIMDSELVREIFEMDETKATDIVVNVANHDEVPTIAKKIREIYPDSRVITKDDLKTSYTNVFNYKSGLFLALFIVSIFTFFIIIYDKASGLSSEERREIGILKAIGWKIDDILKVKLLEALIISGLAYLLAVTLAVGYVFGLQAPLLRELFMGYSVLKPPFDLPFVIDGGVLALIFFTTIPIYTAATIIPAWRAATLDADEAIR